MGLTWNTDMAYLDIGSNCKESELIALNGCLISTGDARYLVNKFGVVQFKHAYLDVPVKFVPSEKQEDYFAIINTSDLSDDDLKEYVKYNKVHPLHRIASSIIEQNKFKEIFLDTTYIQHSSIKATFGDGERLYYSDGDYIIPDAIIDTLDCMYFIEFNNTNKVDSSKITKYRQLAGVVPYNFKVIEINISDIIQRSHKEHSLDFDDLLMKRICDNTEFKKVIDLRLPKMKPVHHFGTCTYCNSPFELVANKNDEAYSPNLKSSKVKLVKFSEKDIPIEDYVSFGGAMLHCPKCKENRYRILYCPECLMKRGHLVPLKMLNNKDKGIYLVCPHYLTTKNKVHGVEIDDDIRCDFSMTIIDKFDNWSNELKVVGNFMDLFKLKTATKLMKKFKAFEKIVIESKVWKGR